MDIFFHSFLSIKSLNYWYSVLYIIGHTFCSINNIKVKKTFKPFTTLKLVFFVCYSFSTTYSISWSNLILLLLVFLSFTLFLKGKFLLLGLIITQEDFIFLVNNQYKLISRVHCPDRLRIGIHKISNWIKILEFVYCTCCFYPNGMWFEFQCCNIWNLNHS